MFQCSVALADRIGMAATVLRYTIHANSTIKYNRGLAWFPAALRAALCNVVARLVWSFTALPPCLWLAVRREVLGKRAVGRLGDDSAGRQQPLPARPGTPPFAGIRVEAHCTFGRQTW